MGVNAVGARKFRRSDGVIGVGFYIDWGGLRQASIAWPDLPASRHIQDEFDRGTIELIGEDETPAVESEANQEATEPQTGPQTEPDETPDETADETPDETAAAELEPEKDPAGNTKSEAQHIRDYLTANPEATNAQVIEHLATVSVEVTASQIAYQRKKLSKNG